MRYLRNLRNPCETKKHSVRGCDSYLVIFSHADFTDFTECCIVSLAAVGYAECFHPEANASGVMSYLRYLRNPRETRNSVIVCLHKNILTQKARKAASQGMLAALSV